MSESPKFEQPPTPEEGDEIFTAEEKAAMYLERSKYSIDQRGKDELTGLNNLLGFNRALEHELKIVNREKKDLAVIFLDLDNFGMVNKIISHTVGNEILKEIAIVLEKSVRETDTVARFGGDEFYIILPRTDTEAAKVVANKILAEVEEISKRLETTSTEINLGASIGITSTALSTDPKELVSFADIAAKKAKQSGKNQIMVS